MIPSKPALCYLCKHYLPGMDPSNDRDKPVCPAFPEGIPSEILNNGFDHRRPLGDETVLFERAEGVSREAVEAWEQEVLEIERADIFAMLDDLEQSE